jgi:hypothetical protein
VSAELRGVYGIYGIYGIYGVTPLVTARGS